MGKKIIISDEEFNKLPDRNPRSKKRVTISQKEFDTLPDENQGRALEEFSGGSTVETLRKGMAVVDYPGAVLREGISKGIEGGVVEGIKGAAGVAVSPITELSTRGIEEAASGKKIASQMGLSKEETIGFGDYKVSPAGMAGLGIEMVADPLQFLAPIKRMAKPIQAFARNRGSKQASRVVAKMLNNVDEGFDAGVIGRQLFEEDLIKHIDNPVKMKNIIGGESTIETIEAAGRQAYKKGRAGSGLIGEISDDLDNFLVGIQDSNMPMIPKELIESQVRFNLSKSMMDQLGGEAFDSKYIESIVKEVSGVLKKENYALGEMRTLKKNIGKTLSSRDIYKGTDQAISVAKESKRGVMNSLDDLIKGHLKNQPAVVNGHSIPDASAWYELQNARMSSLIKTKKLLEKADLKLLQKDDMYSLLSQAGAAATAGGLAATLIDAPLTGALIGGSYHGVRAAADMVGGKAPAFMAKRFKGLEKAAPKIIRSIPQATRELRGREPQSVEEAPLAEQLMRTPLPRNSEEALEKKDFVLAKVAQQAPEMFDHVKEVMENQPEALPEIMPALVMAAPNLFTRDKYNRVDGKILDPQLKELATKDTMDNDELSYLNKTLILNKLNKTGQFDDH